MFISLNKLHCDMSTNFSLPLAFDILEMMTATNGRNNLKKKGSDKMPSFKVSLLDNPLFSHFYM